MAGEDVEWSGEASGFDAADLTGALSVDDDVLDRTVRTIVRACATVPGVDHVGIALAPRGTFDPRSTGDPVADDLDAHQTALGGGPGIEAAIGGEALDVPDLAGTARWAGFAEAAARHDIRGVLVLPLIAHDGVLGVLTLYTRSALTGPGRAQAAALSVQATGALLGAQRIAGLARAVFSRDAIGQAKGILMQRDGVDDEAAFAMLVEASQTTNIKLVDVAHWLVSQTTGTPQPVTPQPVTPQPAAPDRVVPAQDRVTRRAPRR